MKTVFKYVVPNEADHPLYIPKGAAFLKLECQDDQPVVYFLVDTEEKKVDKFFIRYFGTGWEIPEDILNKWNYIGTVMQLGGQLVWHLWILREADHETTRDGLPQEE